MLKELIILAVGTAVMAAATGLIVVWLARLSWERLLGPLPFLKAYLNLVLIDFLGHLGAIVFFMIIGLYSPAISPEPRTWIGNAAFLLIFGAIGLARIFGRKANAKAVIQASALTTAYLLIRDGVALIVLWPYLTGSM